jgi:type VI secretion system secreted protein Hcp
MAGGVMALGDGGGDVFLKVESARQGPIKGESQDLVHKGEIDVFSWSWGMRAQTTIAGGDAGKATINELVVSKKIDSASTALMAAMRNNEVIKKAVLTMRKAGSKQHEFFKFTLQNGRITSLDIQNDVPGTPNYTETLSISFQKLSVEYLPQGADGQLRGGMLFETEIT